jgi:hypothetical protein
MEVLQWARANGCPWDSRTCSSAAEEAIWRCSSGHAPTAAPGTRGPVPRQQEEATWRCCSGHAPTAAPGTELPVWRQQKEATWRCCSGHAPTAAPGTSGPVPSAAEGGHLEVLQWARANGCPWDEDLFPCSRRRPPGGVAVGTRQRLPLGPVDLFQCSSRGHLEVLQWARANGCPWDQATCSMQHRRPPGGVAVGTRQRLPLG